VSPGPVPAGAADPVAVNRDTYDAIALDYHARANRIWPELPAAVVGGSQGRPRFFAHHREPELTSQLGAVGFAVYRVERAATQRNWLIIDAGRTP